MILTSMAELPVARRDRFVADFGLSFHDADVLTDDVIVADYYEQAIASSGGHYREVATWVSGELFALARNRGGFEYVTVTPEHLSEIVTMVASGEINALTGKSVLLDTAESGTAPRQIVMDQGLTQVSDASIVDDVVREIVAANPKAVEDYRSGKQAVVGFLIGQAMKQMRGRGNPDVVRQALLRTLDYT
jgi:aspartyl-tRNA(Asn)/glutamyl-tRNA(Gln) amidotransferase subunit B